MLRIALAPFGDGLHEQTLPPTADDLGLDPGTFAGIEVDLKLDVQGRDAAARRILATFEARATATLECDRTLVLFEQPVAEIGRAHV